VGICRSSGDRSDLLNQIRYEILTARSLIRTRAGTDRAERSWSRRWDRRTPNRRRRKYV